MRSRLQDLSGWKLADRDQDIRGWPVKDDAGRELGRVDEMIVDTDTRHVETVILQNGAEFPVSALHIGRNEVHVARDYAARFSGTGGLMSHGTTGHTTGHTTSYKTGDIKDYTATADREGQIRIPVVEEHVEVGKQSFETTGAKVHTRVTERPVEKEVTLRDEKVTVDRRPADRMATEKDVEMAARGGEIEVTAVREEPVVRKQSRVVEEVIVGKEGHERKETVHEKERKTEVDVDVNKTDTRDTRHKR